MYRVYGVSPLNAKLNWSVKRVVSECIKGQALSKNALELQNVIVDLHG